MNPARTSARGARLKQTAAWLAVVTLAFHSSLAAAPIKIACVGDSITEGSGLSNPAIESYPARLQRLLGTNYIVKNFGVSGRTLLKKGDFPYWKEPAYQQSRDFLPDIVIIKLGSNDAKPYNWKYGTNFTADYDELIGSYTALASTPRILLGTPAPVFKNGAFDIKPGTVATNIAPQVRALAALPGRELIDFHERLADHGEWFPDTVHPNARGTIVMAAIVYQAVVGETGEPVSATPTLTLRPANRLLVEWPAEAAGQVLLGTPTLRSSNLVWLVVDGVFVNDGSAIRTTNTLLTSRFFQLWRP